METQETNSKQKSVKLDLLKSMLAPLIEKGLIIAFSGGVDSGFLLWAAIRTLKTSHRKGRVLALLSVSPRVALWEIESAKDFSKTIGAELLIVNSDEINAKNDSKHCCFCKTELCNLARKEAIKRSYQAIAYGYNASDRRDSRPGHLAVQESNIYSPLEQAGLEKADIREFVRELGFNLADKPTSPGLASRIVTGVRISEEKLQHIHEMESFLNGQGFSLYRVRVHEESYPSEPSITKRYFRIEVAPEEMSAILQIRDLLVKKARNLGYRWVNLDLAGYKDIINESSGNSTP
ncbi:ATP-utilizing enzymes of the PP-loop superfamily protein [Legionella massiliensis]|uniref:ATP-utilizing enzymes of the PP-loop superfamily protein n=1 Tax=Legionella massiliensis TaxID=1034943 RepID=A0A078KP06_9GAMM|nr:ATP-dependent sacrificial sulfur transferase LarE [Legionella massiliensis]CDZ76110.1 ATP-utilizing enzymes of the PP-loop superfamily protein [Legionella massiliensis]CEE11848.1 hypothetical protein BN1094_00374 [Legionella massiliensis]